MDDFEIIVLSETDWQDYKSVRLESLRESPDSFASTYDRELSFMPEQWKSRLRISSSIHDAVAIAAVAEKRFIGLLSCVIREPDTNSAHMYQMWVSPDYRKRGIGTALVNFVKSWAADKGMETLLLSVTTINTEAVSLYQSIGFNPVGETKPLREGAILKSQMMEIKLDANSNT